MSQFIIHLRGLPFRATQEEILKFLDLSEGNFEDFKFALKNDSKPTGECFITCTTEADMQCALEKHNTIMSGFTRPTEVLQTTPNSMEMVLEVYSRPASSALPSQNKDVWDGIVRMRGLPYESNIKDVEEFFTGIPYADQGIIFPLNMKGNSTGQAFIQFETYSAAQEGLSRNKQSIGGRYIELFKSSNDELRKALIEEMKNKHRSSQMQNAYNSIEQFGGEGTFNYGGLALDKSGVGGEEYAKSSINSKILVGKFHPPGFVPGTGYNFTGKIPDHLRSLPGPGSNGYAGGKGRPGQAQNGNSQNPAYGRPEKRPRTAPCPFPNVVAMHGLLPSTSSKMIQDFFEPLKSIKAINNHGTGLCEVAFKTHQDCLHAMNKHGGYCNGARIQLELRSRPPVKTENVWYSQ